MKGGIDLYSSPFFKGGEPWSPPFVKGEIGGFSLALYPIPLTLNPVFYRSQRNVTPLFGKIHSSSLIRSRICFPSSFVTSG